MVTSAERFQWGRMQLMAYPLHNMQNHGIIQYNT